MGMDLFARDIFAAFPSALGAATIGAIVLLVIVRLIRRGGSW